jgi:type I restriction enzyme R subunit
MCRSTPITDSNNLAGFPSCSAESRRTGLCKDQLLLAGVSKDGRDRAANLVKSFEKFIEDNKDEITALQILYSRPYKQRLTHEQLRELARAVERPKQPGVAPMAPERVWQAY